LANDIATVIPAVINFLLMEITGYIDDFIRWVSRTSLNSKKEKEEKPGGGIAELYMNDIAGERKIEKVECKACFADGTRLEYTIDVKEIGAMKDRGELAEKTAYNLYNSWREDIETSRTPYIGNSKTVLD